MSEQPADKTEAPSEAAQRFSQPVQTERSESAEETPAKRPIKSNPVPAGRLVGVAVPIAVIAVVLAWMIRPLLALAVLGAVALAAVGVLIARSMGNRSRSGGSSSPRPSLWSRRPRSQPAGGATRRPLFPSRSSAARSGASPSGAGRSSSGRFFGAGRSSTAKPASPGRQGAVGRMTSSRKGSPSSTTATGGKQPGAAGRPSTSTGRSKFASTVSKPGAGSTATRSPAGKSAAGKPSTSSGSRWFGFGKSKSTQPKPSPSSTGTARRAAPAPQPKAASGTGGATEKRSAASGRGSRWPFKSRRSSASRDGVEVRRDRSRDDSNSRRSVRGRDGDRAGSARSGRDRGSRSERRDDRRDNRPRGKAASAGRKPAAEATKETPEAKAPRGDNTKAAATTTAKTSPSKAKASPPYVPGPIRPAPAPKPAPVVKDDPRMEALAAAVRKAGGVPGTSRQEGNNMYAHLIDPSTPETRAATLRVASEAARTDAANLSEKAERLDREAAGLADKPKMAAAANGMRIEASKARDTADQRVGMAAAYEQVAEEFAAERHQAAS